MFSAVIFAVAAMLLTLVGACGAAEVDPRTLPVEEAMQLEDVRVPFGETVAIPLPPLPARAAKIAVLRFGAVAFSPRPAGCNFNMAMRINGAEVGRRTATGAERLIGRRASFRFAHRDGSDYPVFSGARIMLMYAPDQAAADAMTEDGLGGSFLLDVSDLVSGVDGNTVLISNTRPVNNENGTAYVLIQGMTAGWLDRAALPLPESNLPTRGPIAQTVSRDGLVLAQGTAGGFALAAPGGPELLIETTVSMDREAPSLLRAEDGAVEGATVTSETWSDRGFKLTARFASFALTRHVQVEGGLVRWTEEWTNTSDQIAGLPFRHRLFLRGEAARFTLAGDPDVDALSGCATNPTVFVESVRAPGTGMGVTAESDWLRLLMYARGEAGLGEIYSECLALPPGGCIGFELTITPVTDGDGYWSFINSVRRRWGVNGITMPRPLFWGYQRAPGDDPDDVLRKSLGHLGPIYLTVGGWLRLSADAALAARGAYPKLAPDAPGAPGRCPDFDLDAFLRFEHRDHWWKGLTEQMARIRRLCPEVGLINITHPAMEVVYQPLADRFPIAGEVIRTADGAPFHVHHYDVAHLGEAVARDWAVYYYSPRPGSVYLQALIADCRRSMDQAGSDGIYCDEFSWAGRSRGYSRYDYSRWDGYSADLDDAGRPVRLKSDNAYATESCQLQMTHECLVRGKFFLGNGGSALRSLNSLPIHRFVEGGNGYGTMASGHLSAVPLVLGNFGDQSTRAGVFAALRQCLSIGCVYSPVAVNLLLDGPDNFVCKQYPLTVTEIGPGWVVGQERLITTVAGSFNWPGRPARVRLYRYDATGSLISSDEVVELAADVAFQTVPPEDGLLIAELLP